MMKVNTADHLSQHHAELNNYALRSHKYVILPLEMM